MSKMARTIHPGKIDILPKFVLNIFPNIMLKLRLCDHPIMIIKPIVDGTESSLSPVESKKHLRALQKRENTKQINHIDTNHQNIDSSCTGIITPSINSANIINGINKTISFFTIPPGILYI